MSYLIITTFVLSFLVTCANSITIEDCPPTLSRDRYLQVFKGQCYEFVMYRELEFDNAQKDCKFKGGNLVKIYDRETQMYLYYQLKNVYHQTESVWIGLSDQNTEDKWEWMDSTLPEYTNWAPDQPGIVHGLEDCAAMDPDDSGRWHDYRCTDIFIFVDAGHRYVCQYDPIIRTTQKMTTVRETTPTPATETTTLPPFTETPAPTTPPSTATTTVETSTTAKTMPSSSPPTNPTTETTVIQTSQLTSVITMKPRTTTPTPPPTATTTQSTKITTSPTPPSTTTPAPTTTITTEKSTTVPNTLPTTTSVPTTQTSTAPTTTACPAFNCGVDCGLSGYKKDSHGCALCECDF